MSQLLIAIIALQTLLICLLLILLHRGMITVIQSGLLELDNKIASAIQGIMSGGIDMPDPINPMQQIMLNFIQEKMKPKPDQEIFIKDAQGKFKGA